LASIERPALSLPAIALERLAEAESAPEEPIVLQARLMAAGIAPSPRTAPSATSLLSSSSAARCG
jgi:hypothetical protein